MLVLVMPKEYPYVLVGICFYFILLNSLPFIYVKPMRKKFFTKEFLKKFKKEHDKAFPKEDFVDFSTPNVFFYALSHRVKEIDEGGLPDQGQGWYSKKLEMIEWIELNIAQRIHINTWEQTPFVVIGAGISGLHYPRIACALIFFHMLARIVYARGYTEHPDGRIKGAIFTFLIVNIFVVLSFLVIIWQVAEAAERMGYIQMVLPDYYEQRFVKDNSLENGLP